MKLFDLDGPFQKYGTLVFDLLLLNILCLVITIFSFGILAGPALTGIYAGMYSGVITSEGYTFKTFFKRFKRRFLTALISGIGCIFFIAISTFNLYMLFTNQLGQDWSLPIFILVSSVYMFVFLEVFFVSTYIFPLLAHTDLKFKEIVKTAFLLSNKHLPTTVLSSLLNMAAIGVIILIFVFAYIELFILLFFGISLIVLANTYLITKRILINYGFFINDIRD